MPAEFLSIGAEAISWVATYLLHSTCLMGGVWLLVHLRPATGPTVREVLWKTALVGGLITTPAQMLLNSSASIGALTLIVPAWGEKAVHPNAPLKREDSVEIENVPLDDELVESRYGGLVLENDELFRGLPEFDLTDSLRAVPNEQPETVSEMAPAA